MDATRSRSVDRLINFSDAVVAVAVTLLALPLVDIVPKDGESVWVAINANIGTVIAFVFTFFIVAIMWSAHNRILNVIRDYDGALFWMNTAWLALIVMLPWFTSMYGQSELMGQGSKWPGVGLLYWGAMGLMSLLGWVMGRHIARSPALVADSRRSAPGGMAPRRGLLFGSYFLLIGVASIISPQAASWLPLGIIPLSIWLRPTRASGSSAA